MKILHICMGSIFAEHFGYQENLLPKYQKIIGNEVFMITTTKSINQKGEHIIVDECEDILDDGVKIIRRHVGKKINELLGIYPFLFETIKVIAPDLIFIHGLASMVPAAAIRYKKRKKHVIIVADNHQDKNNAGLGGWIGWGIRSFFKLHWKFWIKDISKVYGVTSWRTQYANQVYGIPYSKLDTLIMGIDVDRMPNNKLEVKKTVRDELNIPLDAFVFVSGGQLNKYKAIPESLRAFIELNSSDTYFILFGKISDDIKSEIEELIKCNDHIKYLGFIDGHEILKYFIASDFGIFPGRHSVLWEEAIGCSLPCLFRRYGEHDHTEICDNCICMDKPDQQKIREIMIKVYQDEDYYIKLKENANKAANEVSYLTIAKKSIECC